jgi:hypothetical protein
MYHISKEYANPGRIPFATQDTQDKHKHKIDY